MFSNSKFKAYYLIIFYIFPSILLAETALYKYAINLESSQNTSQKLISLKYFGVDDKYMLYQTEVKLGRGKSFYRLRVGFFTSKKEASKVALKLKLKFGKLWVDRLHKQDISILSKWRKAIKAKKLTVKNKVAKQSINSKSKEITAKKLFVRADQAMKDKKYRVAASLYIRINNLVRTSKNKDSMEYLGFAREKNGQLIHARAEYRLYLKKYKSGDDYARVRQRLLSLNTQLLKPRRRLRKGQLKKTDGRFFGTLLQFYRKDVFSTNQNSTNNETLSTNVNLLYRKRTDSINIKSQFNATHLKYINTSLKDDKEVISTLFIDVADANNNKSIRLGRQSQNRGGVLGRMDGAWLSYRLNPKWKLNMVAGSPVQTSISNIAQSNRPFIGISSDVGTIAKYWNFNVYTTSQKIDSIIDRNAVGGEVRYKKGKQSHFALVDYDTHFSELNTLYYVGNWLFDSRTSINLSINQRNSPVLTTLNATNGQAGQSIENLLQTYSEYELYQFAKDRTSKYNSIAVSSTIHFTDKWSLVADGTMSNLSSTPASAGVAAIEGTGNEFFYSVQAIGFNVFNTNETMIFQVRYDDTKTYERLRVSASTRFKMKNNNLRFRPKITVENKKSSNGGITNKIGAAIKSDYRLKRKLKFELDVGYEVGQTDFPVSAKENNYYVSAGFVWSF